VKGECGLSVAGGLRLRRAHCGIFARRFRALEKMQIPRTTLAGSTLK
jgi:hypothetical protein